VLSPVQMICQVDCSDFFALRGGVGPGSGTIDYGAGVESLVEVTVTWHAVDIERRVPVSTHATGAGNVALTVTALPARCCQCPSWAAMALAACRLASSTTEV
jgi:hypothetical protein